MYFALSFKTRALTRPGFGRPTILISSKHNGGTAKLGTTERSDGTDYEASFAYRFESNSYIRLSYTTEVNTVERTFITMVMSDDVEVLVEMARPPRDDPDVDEDQTMYTPPALTIADGPTSHGGAAWVSYNGKFTAVDPNGWGSATLPQGIEAVPVTVDTSVQVGLRNNTTLAVVVVTTGAYYGPAAGLIRVVGDRDGTVTDVGNSTCRLSMHFKLEPGQTMFYGPQYYYPSWITYCSLSFVFAQARSVFPDI